MNKDIKISTSELTRSLNDAGYKRVFATFTDNNSAVTTAEPVIKGELCFKNLPSGIQIHCTDIIEERSGKSTSEVSEGISINFLISGNLSYRLDQQTFTFSAATAPIIFANCLGKPQFFTRYLQQGTHIRKLNISVDKPWLMARCNNDQDKLKLQQLFAKKHRVYQWPCEHTILALVEQLFTLHHHKSLVADLETEQVAMQLFGYCYQLLAPNSDHEISTQPELASSISPQTSNHNTYELQLDALSHQSLTLAQISVKLGASISSLQRYFKATYQLTLKEYIRNQKLEQARRSLIFEQQSIGEVAYIAGYKHVSNFNAAFKKHFSITPAALQSQYN